MRRKMVEGFLNYPGQLRNLLKVAADELSGAAVLPSDGDMRIQCV
jgi:hypothetical protein